MRLAGMAPYRCHRCYLRFRRFVPLMYVAIGYQPSRPREMESTSRAEGSGGALMLVWSGPPPGCSGENGRTRRNLGRSYRRVTVSSNRSSEPPKKWSSARDPHDPFRLTEFLKPGVKFLSRSELVLRALDEVARRGAASKKFGFLVSRRKAHGDDPCRLGKLAAEFQRNP